VETLFPTVPFFETAVMAKTILDSIKTALHLDGKTKKKSKPRKKAAARKKAPSKKAAAKKKR
jgi:hypothetical protein